MCFSRRIKGMGRWTAPSSHARLRRAGWRARLWIYPRTRGYNYRCFQNKRPHNRADDAASVLTVAACLSPETAKLRHLGATNNGFRSWVPTRVTALTKPVLHADYSTRTHPRATILRPPSVQLGALLHHPPSKPPSLASSATSSPPPPDDSSAAAARQRVWEPALRHHGGEFYIYYPDPDRGFLVGRKTRPARGEPLLIKGRRWTSPAAVVNYCTPTSSARCGQPRSIRATSSSAHESHVTRLSSTRDRLRPPRQPLLSKPEFYRRYGYYDIFAPAAVVERAGLVLRSKIFTAPRRNRAGAGEDPRQRPHHGAWSRRRRRSCVLTSDKKAIRPGRHLTRAVVNYLACAGPTPTPTALSTGATRRKPNVGNTYPSRHLPNRRIRRDRLCFNGSGSPPSAN